MLRGFWHQIRILWLRAAGSLNCETSFSPSWFLRQDLSLDWGSLIKTKLTGLGILRDPPVSASQYWVPSALGHAPFLHMGARNGIQAPCLHSKRLPTEQPPLHPHLIKVFCEELCQALKPMQPPFCHSVFRAANMLCKAGLYVPIKLYLQRQVISHKGYHLLTLA